MGVIDLDARVKKLEQDIGSAGIDQIEADLTALENIVQGLQTVTKTDFTELTAGNIVTAAGGCYYLKCGNLVHLHLAINELTVNTNVTVLTLPEAIRPATEHVAIGLASNLSANDFSQWSIDTDGTVVVRSKNDGYVRIDITYIVGYTAPTE